MLDICNKYQLNQLVVKIFVRIYRQPPAAAGAHVSRTRALPDKSARRPIGLGAWRGGDLGHENGGMLTHTGCPRAERPLTLLKRH